MLLYLECQLGIILALQHMVISKLIAPFQYPVVVALKMCYCSDTNFQNVFAETDTPLVAYTWCLSLVCLILFGNYLGEFSFFFFFFKFSFSFSFFLFLLFLVLFLIKRLCIFILLK